MLSQTTSTGEDNLRLLFHGDEYPEEKRRVVLPDIDAGLKTMRICPSCQGIEKCVMETRGWQAFYDRDASRLYGYPVFRYGRCHHLEMTEAAERGENIFTPRFTKRSFEGFKVTDENREAYTKCFEYASNLSARTTKGLLLMGPPGTGKTHLAVAIARVAITKRISVGYVVVPELLAELREEMYGDEKGGGSIRAKTERKLVVLDDLGTEKVTDWVLEQLYLIINRRYEKELPTIVTTNCNLLELEARLGKRIVDRLAEMCEIIAMEGKSWRRKK